MDGDNSMTAMATAIAITSGTVEPRFLVPQQLPTIPIEPPDPAAEAYGRMIWDLPSAIDYTPYREVSAVLEAWNPTSIDRLYGIAYYFINPQGTIITQDYLYFTAGGMEFAAFILHAGAPEHMITTILFKAPSAGYRFGLRMLELEIVDSMAAVKYETSRLEILLGGVSINGGGILSALVPGLVALTLVAVTIKTVSKIGGS